MMPKCLFYSEEGIPIFYGDMIWMLIRGNSLYKKRPIYKNPEIYSAQQTIANNHIDHINNKCFSSYSAMMNYYRSRNTLYHRALNFINELI